MHSRRTFLVTSSALLLGACGEAPQPAVDAITATPAPAASSQAPESAVRVTLIMKTLTNPFFITMEQGARRAQQKTGIALDVKTATQETSIEQQIQLVEQAIQSHTQAIVIAPGDSMRLVPVLKKAQDAGVHIVNIDNRLSASAMQASGMQAAPFISIDNEQSAYLSAHYVAKQIKQPTDAVIIEGIRTADNAQQRKRGAERAFKKNPLLRVVATETANWKIDEAHEVAQRLFKAHPRIGVVFCANDMMAIGAIKYLEEAGDTRVLVAGFDALDEAKTALRSGQLAVTIDQQANEQGYLGVMTALKMIRQESVPPELLVPAQLVTASTLR